jgi:GT2 family glycosyltransferase
VDADQELGWMSKLSVVLVNYRGWRDTVACVASLRNLKYSPVEIIVVENGSPDDSWGRLQDLDGVRLVKLEQNLGFAGACNVGMKLAREGDAEFVWLLNNDTVVEPRAASALVELARSRPEAHFFGSLIAFDAEPELLWFGGGDFDCLTGTPGHVGFMQPVATFSSPDPVPTTWISGCSLLLRTNSLDRVGFMDEELFLYAEDLDWQLRARCERPVAWIARDCLVRHKVGRSTGSTNDVMGRVFMSRNHLKLARRHAGISMPMWLARWAVEFLVKPVLKAELKLARAGLAGVVTQRTAGADIVARYSARASK